MSFILRKPNFVLEDTESADVSHFIAKVFGSIFIHPNCFHKRISNNEVRYSGVQELLYLHPNRFSSDDSIFDLLGIEKGTPYVIMRFVSWDAYHDKGLSGFTDDNKIQAVKQFSKHAKVFISAEKELPAELEPYKIRIPPEKMHDALAHASLFFGESATMASESAVLGTPAIYLNNNWLGYTNEEERYGLLFSFKSTPEDQGRAISKGMDLLADPATKETMRENRKRFLSDKIDVTAFMTWFIENYPESFRTMCENPDYADRFRFCKSKTIDQDEIL